MRIIDLQKTEHSCYSFLTHFRCPYNGWCARFQRESIVECVFWRSVSCPMSSVSPTRVFRLSLSLSLSPCLFVAHSIHALGACTLSFSFYSFRYRPYNRTTYPYRFHHSPTHTHTHTATVWHIGRLTCVASYVVSLFGSDNPVGWRRHKRMRGNEGPHRKTSEYLYEEGDNDTQSNISACVLHTFIRLLNTLLWISGCMRCVCTRLR